jgi:hypothetical protein
MMHSIKSVQTRLATIAALALMTTACADVGDGAADGHDEENASEAVSASSASLVAQVEGEGYTVKYLEPEPGLLVEEESGTADARHLPEDKDLDIVQRYELLSGSKAPAALVAAAVRAGIATHEADPIPQVGDHSGDKANPTATEAWFRANYCTQTDRFWGGTMQVGVNTTWSDRVEMMKAGAWVRSGSVSYSISYSGAGETSYGLGTNEYNGRRVTSRINRAAESKVWNTRAPYSAWYLHCVNYHF